MREGGGRVRPHQRVRVRAAALAEDNLGQVLQIHLVADSRVRRYHAEVAKSLLTPAQKGVALSIAFEFALRVRVKGGVGSELIHLDGMVDHQVRRMKGIDLLWIASHPSDRFA